MAAVNVNGINYKIPDSKTAELLQWLEANKESTVLDNSNPNQVGKQIING